MLQCIITYICANIMSRNGSRPKLRLDLFSEISDRINDGMSENNTNRNRYYTARDKKSALQIHNDNMQLRYGDLFKDKDIEGPIYKAANQEIISVYLYDLFASKKEINIFTNAEYKVSLSECENLNLDNIKNALLIKKIEEIYKVTVSGKKIESAIKGHKLDIKRRDEIISLLTKLENNELQADDIVNTTLKTFYNDIQQETIDQNNIKQNITEAKKSIISLFDSKDTYRNNIIEFINKHSVAKVPLTLPMTSSNVSVPNIPNIPVNKEKTKTIIDLAPFEINADTEISKAWQELLKSKSQYKERFAPLLFDFDSQLNVSVGTNNNIKESSKYLAIYVTLLLSNKSPKEYVTFLNDTATFTKFQEGLKKKMDFEYYKNYIFETDIEDKKIMRHLQRFFLEVCLECAKGQEQLFWDSLSNIYKGNKFSVDSTKYDMDNKALLASKADELYRGEEYNELLNKLPISGDNARNNNFAGLFNKSIAEIKEIQEGKKKKEEQKILINSLSDEKSLMQLVNYYNGEKTLNYMYQLLAKYQFPDNLIESPNINSTITKYHSLETETEIIAILEKYAVINGCKSTYSANVSNIIYDSKGDIDEIAISNGDKIIKVNKHDINNRYIIYQDTEKAKFSKLKESLENLRKERLNDYNITKFQTLFREFKSYFGKYTQIDSSTKQNFLTIWGTVFKDDNENINGLKIKFDCQITAHKNKDSAMMKATNAIEDQWNMVFMRYFNDYKDKLSLYDLDLMFYLEFDQIKELFTEDNFPHAMNAYYKNLESVKDNDEERKQLFYDAIDFKNRQQECETLISDIKQAIGKNHNILIKYDKDQFDYFQKNYLELTTIQNAVDGLKNLADIIQKHYETQKNYEESLTKFNSFITKQQSKKITFEYDNAPLYEETKQEDMIVGIVFCNMEHPTKNTYDERIKFMNEITSQLSADQTVKDMYSSFKTHGDKIEETETLSKQEVEELKIIKDLLTKKEQSHQIDIYKKDSEIIHLKAQLEDKQAMLQSKLSSLESKMKGDRKKLKEQLKYSYRVDHKKKKHDYSYIHINEIDGLNKAQELDCNLENAETQIKQMNQNIAYMNDLFIKQEQDNKQINDNLQLELQTSREEILNYENKVKDLDKLQQETDLLKIEYKKLQEEISAIEEQKKILEQDNQEKDERLNEKAEEIDQLKAQITELNEQELPEINHHNDLSGDTEQQYLDKISNYQHKERSYKKQIEDLALSQQKTEKLTKQNQDLTQKYSDLSQRVKDLHHNDSPTTSQHKKTEHKPKENTAESFFEEHKKLIFGTISFLTIASSPASFLLLAGEAAMISGGILGVLGIGLGIYTYNINDKETTQKKPPNNINKLSADNNIVKNIAKDSDNRWRDKIKQEETIHDEPRYDHHH